MFQLISKITFILSFIALSSCASFPGGNIKLKEYPEFNESQARALDFSWRVKGGFFASDFDKSGFNVSFSRSEKPNNKCFADVLVYDYNTLLGCPITNWIAPFTLFAFPLYCQQNFEAKATLKTSSGKVLKEYQLNDRAHEVWSIVIPFLLPIPAVWDAQTEEGWGEEVVKRNIAKALTRQIIHDASKFQECQK